METGSSNAGAVISYLGSTFTLDIRIRMCLRFCWVTSKTEEEALVTRRVLYHCSTAFLKKMNIPPGTAVVDPGVRSIEVANPPSNNSVPPATAVPKPREFYQCCPI